MPGNATRAALFKARAPIWVPFRAAPSDRSDPLGIRVAEPVVAANTLICLIHQASYLLGRQIKRLEADFLKDGGFTERLYAARRGRR